MLIIFWFEIQIRIRSLTPYKKKRQSEFPDILVPPGSNSVTVSLFKAMQSYSAYALAYNIKYEGPSSETKTFTMPQGREWLHLNS